MERGYEGSTASAKLHENKIARIGGDGKLSRLYFSPHILKIVKTFFACKPLGCPHCAFCEPPSRFCIMAEIDRVMSGIQHQFVHSDNLAFAEGGDFNLQIGVLLQ